MNPVAQNPTDAAHQDLQNVLLNGRILLNGLPLTGKELGIVIQGEQILYGKATQFDKANVPVAPQKKKEPNIIPEKKPTEKKE